jgi:antitoxin (DNA-binding transcriptional repressor) of toxin-antitoxin stability system
MKRATISQTKDRFCELLATVKRGETVLVVERDRPIARIVRVGNTARTDAEPLADLERGGVVRSPRRGPLKNVRTELPESLCMLDALRHDREQARF